MDYPQDKARSPDDVYKRIGDDLFKKRPPQSEAPKRETRVFPARGLRRDWTPSALL